MNIFSKILVYFQLTQTEFLESTPILPSCSHKQVVSKPIQNVSYVTCKTAFINSNYHEFQTKSKSPNKTAHQADIQTRKLKKKTQKEFEDTVKSSKSNMKRTQKLYCRASSCFLERFCFFNNQSFIMMWGKSGGRQ